MSLRKHEQRAVHWARQCAMVASAPGLLARIDGVAWRVPHEAVTAQWLLGDVVPGLTVGLPAPEAKPAILRLLRAIPADVRVAASGPLRGSERPDVFERQAQSTVTLRDHDHERTPA